MTNIIFTEPFALIEEEIAYMQEQTREYIEDTLIEAIDKVLFRRLIKDMEEDADLYALNFYNKQREFIDQYTTEQSAKTWREMVSRFGYHINSWKELEDKRVDINRLSWKFRRKFWTDVSGKRLKMTSYSEKMVDIKSVPIWIVIWKYMKVPKYNNRNVCCPFPHHKDSSPSFRIYEKTNSFYCFGCGCSWNVVNFIALMEDTTTKEAYKRFISIFNL